MSEVINMKPLKHGEPCPECGQWFGYGVNAPGHPKGQKGPAFIPKTPDKGWIQTRSGGRFYFLEQKLSSVTLEDIAGALSKLCRYTGHTNRFYSVAEHSFYVSLLVPEEFQLHAMLHDASEAYLGDVSTPLKGLLEEYREIEDIVSRSIYARFDLPATLPACIKSADYTVLASEVPLLFHYVDPGWRAWLTGHKPVDWMKSESIGWTPEQAEQHFLERTRQLWEVHVKRRKPRRDTFGRTPELLTHVRGEPLGVHQTLLGG